jgi:hypothetical protein
MKLFAIYIGGTLPRANIELHDMRFVVAASMLETYEELKRQWWGTPNSLHVDCWAQIDHADGYDVALRPEPFSGAERLFYVNLGGYNQVDFSEQHKNMFVVATSAAQAKTRAVQSIPEWRGRHRDALYEAEQAFSLNQCVEGQRLHLHLTPIAEVKDLSFTCEYTPLKSSTTKAPFSPV